jgi:glucosamine--fructose-6-phosphate aminotransferase (isomerizing)
VAASKTFTTQMVALHLLALYLAQVRGTMYPAEVAEQLAVMRSLPGKVATALTLEREIRKLAERYADQTDVLFIGRHTGYPAAMEGALKLKEISYLHAEGYPAAELKHGPIALVEDGTPVVVVHPSSHVYAKMLTNIQEVAARGAAIIAVAEDGDREVAAHATHVLRVPAASQLLAPLVYLIPLQLLSYHVAVARGCPIDKPRNLAKSVTVE